MKGPNVDLLKVAPPVLDVDSVGDMEVVDLAVQGELIHLRRLGSLLLGLPSAGIPAVGYFEL